MIRYCKREHCNVTNECVHTLTSAHVYSLSRDPLRTAATIKLHSVQIFKYALVSEGGLIQNHNVSLFEMFLYQLSLWNFFFSFHLHLVRTYIYTYTLDYMASFQFSVRRLDFIVYGDTSFKTKSKTDLRIMRLFLYCMNYEIVTTVVKSFCRSFLI